MYRFNASLLKEFLAKKGKSKVWLSEKSGLSERTIHYVLFGKAPTLDTLIRIMRVMGTRNVYSVIEKVELK